MDIENEIAFWRLENANKRYETIIEDMYRELLLLKCKVSLLEPDIEDFEKYPALKEAYNNYMLVKMLSTGKK